jgi:hypothetical protein
MARMGRGSKTGERTRRTMSWRVGRTMGKRIQSRVRMRKLLRRIG